MRIIAQPPDGQQPPTPGLTVEQAQAELDQFCELIRNKKQGVRRGVRTAKAAGSPRSMWPSCSRR